MAALIVVPLVDIHSGQWTVCWCWMCGGSQHSGRPLSVSVRAVRRGETHQPHHQPHLLIPLRQSFLARTLPSGRVLPTIDRSLCHPIHSFSMSDTVLYSDEEKAGPVSTLAAESTVASAKKEEEFRNYKNSKRQAVTSHAQHTLHSTPQLGHYRLLVSHAALVMPVALGRLWKSSTVCSTRIRRTTLYARWRRSQTQHRRAQHRAVKSVLLPSTSRPPQPTHSPDCRARPAALLGTCR